MLGITDKQIREIDLGPRQIFLFDIEDDASADRERVMACLAVHVERLGEADLEDFVQSAGEALGLDAAAVLQHLFWLAHDMEIIFQSRHGPVPARQVKQMLVDLRQADLRMVRNQPVEASVLNSVREFFERMDPDMGPDAWHDQTGLARSLARRIREWKRSLDNCRMAAGKPGFPGASDIDDGLKLIASITAKWDAYSLLHAVHAHLDRLGQLAQSATEISAFYAGEAERWQVLLQFAAACRKTVAQENGEPAAADLRRLDTILSDSRPYGRVEEAWRLYRSIKPVHDGIVARRTQQRREEARSRVAALIRKMRDHLEAHGADDDLRNQSLFTLRARIRCIEEADRIDRIEGYLRDAEEAYEFYWGEVGGR